MAILATAVWEVRPTNGDNTFGGGYDAGIAGAGTDYSQQTAAQLSLTDLVSTASTTITSVTGGFTTAMIGNALRLNSGTGATVGFYFITASPDANTITVDRASGTYADGAGKIGGATKSLSGQTTTTLAASLVGDNFAHIKNEAWDESATLSVSTASGTKITIEGYNAARGDAPTGTNRPLNDRNSAGVPLTITGTGYHIRHLRFTRSSAQGVTGSGTAWFYNCQSYNNVTSGFATTGTYNYIGCESNNNTTTGFDIGNTSSSLFGCYSHDNTTTGLSGVGGSPSIHQNIFEANASHGLSFSSGPALRMSNNTIDGNTGASTDGLNFGSLTASLVCINNIFSNNGRDGVRATDGDVAFAANNCFFGNAGVARTLFTIGINDVTSDPAFTDRANGDFSVGANMKALGFPNLFPGGLSTSYLDIGAVQRRESSPASFTF